MHAYLSSQVRAKHRIDSEQRSTVCVISYKDTVPLVAAIYPCDKEGKRPFMDKVICSMDSWNRAMILLLCDDIGKH
jgi:hypothetical protein